MPRINYYLITFAIVPQISSPGLVEAVEHEETVQSSCVSSAVNRFCLLTVGPSDCLVSARLRCPRILQLWAPLAACYPVQDGAQQPPFAM